ncbi:MAG: hypothetical protein HRT37_05435 [Alteromonadaceae bacterium]|nr:hypothetical protein [Alteromonadaceae bacterium]
MTTSTKISLSNQHADQPHGITPQGCGCGSTGACGCSTLSFIYALGQFRLFFPSVDLQKEFIAATHALNVKQDDYYAVFTYSVNPGENSSLSFRPFLYIAEQACWVFSVNSVDTYLMVPRSEIELNTFINALNLTSDSTDFALTGTMGPIAPPHYCGNLKLPIVIANQFEVLPDGGKKALMIKANDGAEDVDRAINFLMYNYVDMLSRQTFKSHPLRSMRYQFYKQTQGRTVVEIIFTYFNNGVESFYSCGVDVTDQYPFIDFPLRTYVPAN